MTLLEEESLLVAAMVVTVTPLVEKIRVWEGSTRGLGDQAVAVTTPGREVTEVRSWASRSIRVRQIARIRISSCAHLSSAYLRCRT